MRIERFHRAGIRGKVWYGSPLATLAHKLWGAEAIAVGHTIHVVASSMRISECAFQHELEHIRQWDFYGWRFAALYRAETRKSGYAGNVYEVEPQYAEQKCRGCKKGGYTMKLTD